MDAIVTAGGIPLPEDPLYPYTRGEPKALVDVAGKPMVQWVLNALSDAKNIDNIVIVGLTDKSNLKCGKKLFFIPNQGKMLDNLRVGVKKIMEIEKKTKHVVIVSSDIPSITGTMVDWVIDTAMETDDDIYYNVVPRKVMEKRFPNSKRTWTHLKDMDVCGGDMNVTRAKLISEETALWEKIVNARKSPIKQAALIGYGAALQLIIRRLTLQDAVEKVVTKLSLTGRAIVCPYAEVGMDVDKPGQLEILRRDLKKRGKQVEKKVRLDSAKSPIKAKKVANRLTKKYTTQSLKGTQSASSQKGKKTTRK